MCCRRYKHSGEQAVLCHLRIRTANGVMCACAALDIIRRNERALAQHLRHGARVSVFEPQASSAHPRVSAGADEMLTSPHGVKGLRQQRCLTLSLTAASNVTMNGLTGIKRTGAFLPAAVGGNMHGCWERLLAEGMRSDVCESQGRLRRAPLAIATAYSRGLVCVLVAYGSALHRMQCHAMKAGQHSRDALHGSL